ncbi:MAG TPA: CDP-alcohol phosphatidyltransferase family protein [Clostridia bacterium]|nr:CDP-alcohol phosphatidyltransferase family protein [Clostridia bacterium]
MTVPNFLSVTRIFLIPIFAVLFYKDYLGWAVFVLFLSGFSDFLDGKIARRYNQISELGKILDPVADKLTQITLAVMLFIFFRASSNATIKAFSWVFLFFIFKELVMVLIGAIMLAKGLRPSAAEIYGKAATFTFYAVMLLIVGFGPEIGAVSRHYENLVLPDTVMMILVVISAVLTLVAMLSYVPGTIKKFRDKAANNKAENKE